MLIYRQHSIAKQAVLPSELNTASTCILIRLKLEAIDSNVRLFDGELNIIEANHFKEYEKYL
ncbi:MAG TPA: hypothetical protein VIP70_05695 [Nitrososphaeraceae archaeon]